MVLEQEMASIMKFVIRKAGEPTPYYWNVPQNFQIPAVYFPPPELDTGGETFLTYNVDYAWYIKMFHKTEQEAFAMAYSVAHAIRASRNLLPIIAPGDGADMEGFWVRVNDPSVKVIDDGAAQLTITWRSRMPYQDTFQDRQRVMDYHLDVFMQPEKTISDAYADALERYSVILTPGSQPE